MRSYQGKVVLLTGASEGIGRALALLLARAGARLALAARNAARLDSLAVECRALGAQAEAVAGDVSSQADCGRLAGETLARFGAIDVLVLNAGATMWTTLAELRDEALLERLVRTNYLGAAWLAKAALPALVTARGRIVAIASIAGYAGLPTRTGYAASKHAMVGFFDSLRIELDGTGVSVTIVAPDFVRSEIHRRAAGPDGRALGENPMKDAKIMSAEDCARIIAEAALARRRLVFTSFRGRALRWFQVFAPSFVDRLAARAIRNRR